MDKKICVHWMKELPAPQQLLEMICCPATLAVQCYHVLVMPLVCTDVCGCQQCEIRQEEEDLLSYEGDIGGENTDEDETHR